MIVAVLAAGVIAFAVRSSMVYALLARGRSVPVRLERAFTAAIPAGLAATVVAGVAARGGDGPARAGALAVAGLVASRTDSMLVVVGAGLAALWVLLALV
jgi:hypothetical protein